MTSTRRTTEQWSSTLCRRCAGTTQRTGDEAQGSNANVLGGTDVRGALEVVEYIQKGPYVATCDTFSVRWIKVEVGNYHNKRA